MHCSISVLQESPGFPEVVLFQKWNRGHFEPFHRTLILKSLLLLKTKYFINTEDVTLHFSSVKLVAMPVFTSSENLTVPLLVYSENPNSSFSPLSQDHAPVIHPLSCFTCTWFSGGEKHFHFQRKGMTQWGDHFRSEVEMQLNMLSKMIWNRPLCASW